MPALGGLARRRSRHESTRYPRRLRLALPDMRNFTIFQRKISERAGAWAGHRLISVLHTIDEKVKEKFDPEAPPGPSPKMPLTTILQRAANSLDGCTHGASRRVSTSLLAAIHWLNTLTYCRGRA
jgi:hypothetical protein